MSRHLPATRANPESRLVALQQKIGELITDDDIDLGLAVLREAMNSQISIRAPRGPDGKNNYLLVRDMPSAIAAVKLMFAYKFGMAPSHHEVSFHGGPMPGGAPGSVEDDVRDLVESGADMKKVFDVWMAGMKPAEPAAGAPPPPKPAAPAKKEAPQTVELIDV